MGTEQRMARSDVAYAPPTLKELGTLHELTLQVCTKQLGAGDGFTFHGETIFCTSR
jgi:hypothetical protein